MENQKNCKTESLLGKYHLCTKHIGRGCRALESALKEANQPLSYASKWLHYEGSNRVGILFYDMLQSRNRWISVPIGVFDSGEWSEFVNKYCKFDKKDESI